jgi:hypothetical protein
MAILTKQILRFGARDIALAVSGAGTEENSAFAGFPDPALARNVAIIPPLPGSWANAPITRPFDPNVPEATFPKTAQSFQVPVRHGGEGPVTAITIAPDSPIEALDLYLDGGRVPHRIAPGAPFIGTIDDQLHMRVAPVRDLPSLSSFYEITDSANYPDEICAWEIARNSVNGQTVALYPARINLIRGSVNPSSQQRRAPYTANVVWEIKDRGGAVPTIPTLQVCTDGRRRVRVIATMWNRPGAAASLEVYGVEGVSAMTRNNSGLNAGTLDLPAFDQLLAATPLVIDLVRDKMIPTIFDWPGGGVGNPYFRFDAHITGGVIGTRGELTVHAWDD